MADGGGDRRVSGLSAVSEPGSSRFQVEGWRCACAGTRPAVRTCRSYPAAKARYDTGPTVAPVGPARTTQIAFRSFRTEIDKWSTYTIHPNGSNHPD